MHNQTGNMLYEKNALCEEIQWQRDSGSVPKIRNKEYEECAKQ
jgi:hypothetical protein